MCLDEDSEKSDSLDLEQELLVVQTVNWKALELLDSAANSDHQLVQIVGSYIGIKWLCLSKMQFFKASLHSYGRVEDPLLVNIPEFKD